MLSLSLVLFIVLLQLLVLHLLKLDIVLGWENRQDEWSFIVDVVVSNSACHLVGFELLIIDCLLVELLDVFTNPLDSSEHVFVADMILLERLDCVNDGLNSGVRLFLPLLACDLGSWSHRT